MQVVGQHPGIDTIDASLQLEFGFIKVTSIRILERTVLLWVVSVLIEGDFMMTRYIPKGAVYILYCSGPSTEP